MGDSFERGDPFEAHETFDAIHAAGMAPAEIEAGLSEGSSFEWGVGAGAPPLVSYGANSTLRYEAGADAIPTSVTMPPGAEPATPVPEPSPAPQELGSPQSVSAPGERSAEREQSIQRDERGRQQTMERREDSATGAMAMDESGVGSAPGAEASAPGAGTGAEAPGVSEWTLEVEETAAPSRTQRIALIAGAGAMGGLAIAGGVTWFIIQRRRMMAARALERALAASRLLRMTPATARPYVLEAAQARASATQLAQQSAAETARMARALRMAAGASATAARDYATERSATAQEAISGALDTARGAGGTWRTMISRTGPSGARWLGRAFRAGRYAGRIEQRFK